MEYNDKVQLFSEIDRFNGKTGLPKQLLDLKDNSKVLSSELLCSRHECGNILERAWKTGCGHRYCEECIQILLRPDNESTCVECVKEEICSDDKTSSARYESIDDLCSRDPEYFKQLASHFKIERSSVEKDRDADRCIRNLNAVCPNDCEDSNHKLIDIKDHIRICPQREVKCKTCGDYLKFADLVGHECDSYEAVNKYMRLVDQEQLPPLGNVEECFQRELPLAQNYQDYEQLLICYNIIKKEDLGLLYEWIASIKLSESNMAHSVKNGLERTQLEAKITTMASKFRQRRKDFISFCDTLLDGRLTPQNGEFRWDICNVSTLLELARESDIPFRSRTFLTRPSGYKIYLVLRLDELEEHSIVGLYLKAFPDPRMEWPVEFQVVATLSNSDHSYAKTLYVALEPESPQQSRTGGHNSPVEMLVFEVYRGFMTRDGISIFVKLVPVEGTEPLADGFLGNPVTVDDMS